jgi:hypothetical protein
MKGEFMPKSTRLAATLFVIILLAFVAGCSDNTTSPNDETTSLDIVDLESMIEDVAPPEYAGPSSSPSSVDSVWSYGDHALLRLVFGDEPQSLYSNAAQFSEMMTAMETIMEVNANGEVVTGSYSDTVSIDGMDIPVIAIVTALTEPTPVPTEAQAIFGTTFDLDYLISVTVIGDENMNARIGLSISSTQQTIAYLSASEPGSSDEQADLRYASFNLVDSTFTFKGLGYNHYASGEYFLNAFDISSTTDNDFAYRVCWYNEYPEASPTDDSYNCIIGGGNNQTEFALKYRRFIGDDFTEVDSTALYEQLFDPNYGEGTGLISDYDEYIDDALLFDYDVLSHVVITDPWEE